MGSCIQKLSTYQTRKFTEIASFSLDSFNLSLAELAYVVFAEWCKSHGGCLNSRLVQVDEIMIDLGNFMFFWAI